MYTKIGNAAKFIMIVAASVVVLLEVVIIFTEENLLSQWQNDGSIRITLKQEDYSPPKNSNEPFDLRILNPSESSFTVFFRTSEATNSYIQVGQNKTLRWKILDSRINDEKSDTKFYNHFFEFSDSDAVPEAEYEYRIVSNGEVFDNKEQLYSVNLSPLLSSPPSVISFEGKCSISKNQNDRVAILSAVNTSEELNSTYSGLLLEKENFIISIGGMRDISQKSYIYPKHIKVELLDGEKYYSTEVTDFDSENTYKLILK